jgi:hydrogenase maturation factor
MLIACLDGPGMVGGLAQKGIASAVIGRVTEIGQWITEGGVRRELEISYRDELWRILETGRGSLQP